MEAASVRPMQVSIKEKFVKPDEKAAVVTPKCYKQQREYR